MKKYLIYIVVFLVVVIAGVSYFRNAEAPIEEDSSPTLGDDPLNTTYIFDGKKVVLSGGRAEEEAAPESASKLVTTIFGEPIYGDLDNDGDEDAGLILTQSGGGSGTFFYVAAAEKIDGGFSGTEAVLLGDRIAPQTTEIRNGILIANYADRAPGEPMTARPSIGISRYALLRNGRLTNISSSDTKNRPFAGMLTIGGEVRSFALCGESNNSWIRGESPAIKTIIESYNKEMAGSNPYTPIFAILTGRVAERVQDGFGADYHNSFFAEKLVDIIPGVKCTE